MLVSESPTVDPSRANKKVFINILNPFTEQQNYRAIGGGAGIETLVVGGVVSGRS